MLAVHVHLPAFRTFWHTFQENLFCDITRHLGEIDWLVDPRVLLIKDGYDIPFYPVTGDFTWLPGRVTKKLHQPISSGPQVVPHWIPQAVLSIIFSYDNCDFIPQVSALK